MLTASVVENSRIALSILAHGLTTSFRNLCIGIGICAAEILAELVIEDIPEVFIAIFIVSIAEGFGHWGSDRAIAVEDKVIRINVVAHPLLDLGWISGIVGIVPLDQRWRGTFRRCWSRGSENRGYEGEKWEERESCSGGKKHCG